MLQVFAVEPGQDEGDAGLGRKHQLSRTACLEAEPAQQAGEASLRVLGVGPVDQLGGSHSHKIAARSYPASCLFSFGLDAASYRQLETLARVQERDVERQNLFGAVVRCDRKVQRITPAQSGVEAFYIVPGLAEIGDRRHQHVQGFHDQALELAEHSAGIGFGKVLHADFPSDDGGKLQHRPVADI
jgi:hypothetical protein